MEELFSSQFHYYSISKEFSDWAGLEITFCKKIDVELLQDVVRRSFVRYPYMAEKVVTRGERYVLVQNEKPFIIHTDKESPMYFMGPNNDDYQIRFSVWDNILDARFFHGLCDGRGFIVFMKSVLFEYFNISEGHMPSVPNVNLFSSELLPEEYQDPFLNREFQMPKEESGRQDNEAARRPFIVPESVDSDGHTHCYRMSMKEDQFMMYSKGIDGSPNAIVALFMARAILSEFPEASDNIVAGISVDLRNALDRPLSHFSEIDLLPVRYQKKMEELPLTTQATCIRGKIIIGSDPDRLRDTFAAKAGFYNVLQNISSSKRTGLIGQIAEKYRRFVTFVVSYVGRSQFGEIEQYMESEYVNVESYDPDILIEITCLNGKFYLNLMQTFSSDRYVKALMRQFESAGIECVFEEEKTLIPMVNDIA